MNENKLGRNLNGGFHLSAQNNKIESVEKMFSEKHSPEPFRIYGAGFIVSEVFRHFSEGGQ